MGTLRAGRGTPESLGLGCEIWAPEPPGIKKGVQDLGKAREARRGVPGVGAAKRAGPGSYLPGPRRLRAELGFRRDVGWGGGTGRGPWRRPGPGSVAPEPCLRRSRGFRVSGSGLGAGDPPSPSRSHSPLPPKIAPCPYHRSASPPRGRSRQIQGCPPAPPKSHLPPQKNSSSLPPPAPVRSWPL